MQLRILLFPFISLAIISCGHVDPNEQIDEGNVTGEIYQSDEIGWTIEIPKGWNIVSKDQTEASDKIGKDAMEKAANSEIDIKGLKHLISFQKNQFNIFASTSEPFIEDYPGEYEQNNKTLIELIYETYMNQGIKADTSSGKDTIQGLEFSTFHATIYTPDGKIILHQILYSKLINGFDFGVTINYNNEEDKKTMVDALENSKFVKKPDSRFP